MTSLTDPERLPVSLSGGAPPQAVAARPRSVPSLRSLRARLAVLLLVFLAVPLILYLAFRQADLERQSILLDTVRNEGKLIAAALAPTLAAADGSALAAAPRSLARFTDSGMGVKLLFKPNSAGSDAGFFFVAGVPEVPVGQLQAERNELADQGVLNRLAASCQGDSALALRVALPGGADEVLTSITPVQSTDGCWAVVIANSTQGIGSAVPGAFWLDERLAIGLAAYLVMALLVGGLLFGLWRSLSAFGRTARDIRLRGAKDQHFAERTAIPELAQVAREFDAMVGTLAQSATLIRQAAEDNAHAFKGPLGVIRQALEPLRRRLDTADPRALQALEAVTASVTKLEGLVQSARRLEEATADMLDLHAEPVDLSALVRRLALDYEDLVAGKARLEVATAAFVQVRGRDDLLETAIENLLDNAISFSPPGGLVSLSLSADDKQAHITVCDRGPGVPPARLAKIFDRYYSDRPQEHESGALSGHFGIGLWLVRRHVESMDGSVSACNRERGGLAVTITLPRLKAD
jgi:two-component system sensor histidine kinase ChvG